MRVNGMRLCLRVHWSGVDAGELLPGAVLSRVSVCFARLDVWTGLQLMKLVKVYVVRQHQLVFLALIILFICLSLQCLLQYHLFFLSFIEKYLFRLRCGLGPLRI